MAKLEWGDVTSINMNNNVSNVTAGALYDGSGYVSTTGIGDFTFQNRSNDVVIDGELKVNGRDILKEIDDMRDVLLLLRRDVDMEAKYPKLKELKEEYERALEKYKTFEAVKGDKI
jgi:hypothetical protein